MRTPKKKTLYLICSVALSESIAEPCFRWLFVICQVLYSRRKRRAIEKGNIKSLVVNTTIGTGVFLFLYFIFINTIHCSQMQWKIIRFTEPIHIICLWHNEVLAPLHIVMFGVYHWAYQESTHWWDRVNDLHRWIASSYVLLVFWIKHFHRMQCLHCFLCDVCFLFLGGLLFSSCFFSFDYSKYDSKQLLNLIFRTFKSRFK